MFFWVLLADSFAVIFLNTFEWNNQEHTFLSNMYIFEDAVYIFSPFFALPGSIGP